MNTAIHKSTGKIISVWKLLNDLGWKGKEREEFLAPYHEIGNWNELKSKGITEVKVGFVKKHLRTYPTGDETFVSPHFRIETKEAKENPLNESEEHLLAKENIYDALVDDNLILNIKGIGDKKISDFGEIEDIRIERGVGWKRIDVLVNFKNKNSEYGKGIAFEVQISPQNKRETVERSYDRASYGYSVVWVWSDDLKNETGKYVLIPYNEAIKKYHSQIKNNLNHELWDISKRANEKVNEINLDIEKHISGLVYKREQLKEDINLVLSDYKKATQILKEDLKQEQEEKLKVEIVNEMDLIKNKLNNLIKDFGKDIQDKIQNEKEFINVEIGTQLKKFIDNQFKDKINSVFLTNYPKLLNDIVEKHIQKDELSNNIKTILNLRLNEKINRIGELNITPVIEKKVSKSMIDIRQDISNSLDDKIKKYLFGYFQKNLKESVEKQTQFLKADYISQTKPKLEYYLKCSKCNKEKHIMTFDTYGLCDSCNEEKGEK